MCGNELVLVSVRQGFYLWAFGELMKEFPCCPTAKKKQESRKAGTRRATRGPASSGGLCGEHALQNQRKHLAFPRLERPGPPCLGEHPSAQTSLSSLQPLCGRSALLRPLVPPLHGSPGDREIWHLGKSAHPTHVFSRTPPYKGKAPLSPSSL